MIRTVPRAGYEFKREALTLRPEAEAPKVNSEAPGSHRAMLVCEDNNKVVRVGGRLFVVAFGPHPESKRHVPNNSLFSLAATAIFN
jgi:hypothetical protein